MIAALLAAAFIAAPPPAGSGPLATIESSFVCPESLPNDQAREAALRTYMDTASAAEPNFGIPRLMLLRKALLAEHKCDQTLDNLTKDEARINGGQVRDQAWAPVINKPSLKVYLSADFLEPYLDPRSPDEHDVIETYLKVYSTVPLPLEGDAGRYDELISHVIYYCASNRAATVMNHYFLAGKIVAEDPEPFQTIAGRRVFELHTPRPDSLEDIAMDSLCADLRGLK